MQLKHRFFLIFSALAALPLMLFSYIAYTRYTGLSNAQIAATSSNIMDQAVIQTNSVFSSLLHILENVQSDSHNEDSLFQSLENFCSADSDYSEADIYTANQQMKNIFQNLTYSTENINGIFIFTPSGVILGQGYGNGVDVRSDYDPAEDEWYLNTLAMGGKMYIDGVKLRSFLLNDTPSLSFSMCIYDVYTRDFMGILYINCAPDILSMDSVNVLPEATFFSIERNGETLYESGTPLDSDNPDLTIAYTRELSIPDVTLTAVFDRAGLAADFRGTLYLLGAAMVVVFVLFIAVAYFLARNVTRPIVELSRMMAHPGETHEILESPYLNRPDEIGTLYNQYVKMLEENNRYIKTQFENQLILMDSQMRSMEAQINAHFLYNTLEAINSLASIEGSADISTMALALGDMFRYSIKTKSALVTVKEELTHVQNFVAIQLIRFDNEFSFRMDVPDELLDCQILKLILQPLVENALYHGLLNCSAGSSICLCARESEGELLFSVTDDGVGMEPQVLENLRASLDVKPRFQELNQRESGGIGLKNIHSRIRLYYGDAYGIRITSEKNKGTTVSIRLPRLTNQQSPTSPTRRQ